jgi:hypothetical protein
MIQLRVGIGLSEGFPTRFTCGNRHEQWLTKEYENVTLPSREGQHTPSPLLIEGNYSLAPWGRGLG